MQLQHLFYNKIFKFRDYKKHQRLFKTRNLANKFISYLYSY